MTAPAAVQKKRDDKLTGVTKALGLGPVKVKVKDAEKGIVELVFATFNVKDHDDEWTLPGAFDGNSEVIISAYGHRSWMGGLPVGRGVITADQKEAKCEAQFFLDTETGRETFAVIKNLADLQEWSYGFDILETGELGEELRQIGVWRVIKKARVYEVSPVLRGAGLNTRTVGVKERETETETAPPAPEAPKPPETQKQANEQLARFMKTRHRLGD